MFTNRLYALHKSLSVEAMFLRLEDTALERNSQSTSKVIKLCGFPLVRIPSVLAAMRDIWHLVPSQAARKDKVHSQPPP